jgi:peptide/nickel transport system substrate-binding protein
MFDFLIGATPDGKLSPDTGALKSWTPNADATVWTLALRPGMKWQDGSDITSADLDFTLKQYADPRGVCGQVCGALKANLASTEIVDGLTVKMNLKAPDVNIPAEFGPIEANAMLLPKAHTEQTGWDGFENNPMGSGPWKFVSRIIGQSIDYDANPNYWDPTRIPKFKHLHIVLAADQNTRESMLKAGEADLINISPDQVPTLEQAGTKILTIANTVFTEIYFFESYKADNPTNKLEFRKALAEAIDMDTLVKSFYPTDVGGRYGDSTPFSPQTLGHDPNLKPYAYNLDEAKSLLTQAGYNGSVVKLWDVSFSDNPEQGDVNQAIASYWKKAGVNVEIDKTDYPTLSQRYAAGTWDPAPIVNVTGFPTSNRPSVLTNIQTNMLSPDAGGVLQGYWNQPKMDGYFKELSGIVDQTARDTRLRQINDEIHDEYWTIPIALKNTPYAAGPRIASWSPIAGTSKVLTYESLVPAQ